LRKSAKKKVVEIGYEDLSAVGKPVRVQKLLEQYGPLVKLDIGCGEHPQEGFIGIDVQAFKDHKIIQHDIETYPWPLPSGSISLAMASHVVEHISRANFGFVKFMNEVWRVLKPGAQFMISAPYGLSALYIQDPTHQNPINENIWHYFDPLSAANFYRFYRPAPWKTVNCVFNVEGFIEVVLEKRRNDPSYGYKEQD